MPRIEAKVLTESELRHVTGGMFGPFVNGSGSHRLPPSPASAAPVTFRSLAGAVAEGAVTGAFAAGAAPPQARPTLVATSALMQGLRHCAGRLIQNAGVPGGEVCTHLAVAAKGRPLAPKFDA